jgi:hypothetical protein
MKWSGSGMVRSSFILGCEAEVFLLAHREGLVDEVYVGITRIH